MRRIKKLNVKSIAFCVDSHPANFFDYLVSKSDEPNEIDPGNRKFLLDSTGEHLTVGINKSVSSEDQEKIKHAVSEIDGFFGNMPPSLIQPILDLVNMAGLNVGVQKSDDSSRLDALEALIVEKFGKKEVGVFDSLPDSFLPPDAQSSLAKQRIKKLQKAIDEEEDESPPVKKKPQKKSIDGYTHDDDDNDDDELPGMPVLSSFLEYHRPPVKEE